MIQQILWELQMDYIGHPYYVSGNAILHALGQHLPRAVHQELSASHGMFVPGQFGRYPPDHSQDGIRPYLGSGLPPVERYADLFLQRRPVQNWLLASRARDALNTHDLRIHGGHPALAHETIMGRRADQFKDRQTTKWYVHAYLSADDPSILPLGEAALSNCQFGGKRNYGYGEVTLKETRMVDTATLDYSRLEGAAVYLIEVISPYVLTSEYPAAEDHTVPRWWAEDRPELRVRKEKILEQRKVYDLETIDHGQIVRYDGDRPIETARNGITRVGTHSRYGFGELQVIPLDEPERVRERNEGADA